MADRKIAGFKKFSDMKTPKIEEFNPALDFDADTDADLPMNPNIPNKSKKIEKPASREKLMPKKQDINLVSDEKDWYDEKEIEVDEDSKVKESVKTYGRVAKFPKGVKASKAFNFLESVKTSKKNIWYMLIEQMQGNELQMVKYNNTTGVDVNKFINELKAYYISQNKTNKLMCEALSKIGVEGNSNLSRITSIPKIKLDGKLLITKITEDLIQLLSK